MTVQTVPTDYGRVAYRVSGGNGPTVVFIHGNSSSSSTWAPQLDRELRPRHCRRRALIGWSLGGHIALEALTIMDDLRGVAVFGTPPVGIPPRMEDAFHPEPAMALRSTR